MLGIDVVSGSVSVTIVEGVVKDAVGTTGTGTAVGAVVVSPCHFGEGGTLPEEEEEEEEGTDTGIVPPLVAVAVVTCGGGVIFDIILPGVPSGTGEGCKSPWSGRTRPRLLTFDVDSGKGTWPALDLAKYSLKATASSDLTAGTGIAVASDEN